MQEGRKVKDLHRLSLQETRKGMLRYSERGTAMKITVYGKQMTVRESLQDGTGSEGDPHENGDHLSGGGYSGITAYLGRKERP